MAETLEKSFAVLEAADGKEGLKIALKEKPAVILLDLLMPKVDGHEFMDSLRKDSWGAKVPVVVLTNQDDPHNVFYAHDANITEYIIKSNVSLDELTKKVKAAVLSAV